MKILMLTPYLPFPPSSGGQIRSFNLIKYLSRRHEITLYSLIKEEKEKKYIPELKKYCLRVRVFRRSSNPWTLRNIVRTGIGFYPFLVIRNMVSKELTAVKEELDRENYDLIHAETFYVMPHLPETKTPVLLVDQTIEYLVYKHYVDKQAPIFLRPLLAIDLAKLKYWEKTYWKKAKKVVAVSIEDKTEMLRLAKDLDVGIVPNGVDLDFFKVKKSWSSKNPKILFVANFKWLQNIEAAKILINKIFPLVRGKNKNIKLLIVGQHIPETILKEKGPSILVRNLKGDDEDGIRNAYIEASIFVSPLKGPGGTRLKHFAAMASKLPLITSTVGAEGLGGENGKHLLVKNSPEAISKAVLDLVTNPKRAKMLAENARKLVVEKFSWQKMAKKLDDIYSEMVTERK